MPRIPGSPQPRLAIVADLALVTGLVVACWSFAFRLESYPPYVDYDTATVGIFVNNLTYHGQYDHGFREASEFQDRYRSFWAAHFLPVSAVLSGLQRLAGVEPENTGEMLKVVTLLLGLAGCASAAALVQRGKDTTWRDAAFLVGFTASFPAFLLYVRSDIVHVLSFALFWSSLLFLVRFLESRKVADGCLLAMLLSVFLLQPAPSLPALVLVALVLVIRRARNTGVRSVAHPRALACLLLVPLLYWTIPMLAAWTSGADPADVRARAARFVELRSGRAFSAENRSPALLGDKLTKLVHQHFAFARDDLGDPTREDEIWTLPSPQPVWLLLIPFALAGLLRSIRRADENAVLFAGPFVCVVLVLFTISFPEGRYLLPVVPCYAFGLLAAAHAWIAARSVRVLACAAVLASMGIASFLAVRGEYSDSMLAAGRGMAGLRESISLIRREHGRALGVTAPLLLVHEAIPYKERLYLAMLTNSRYRLLDPDDLVGLAQAESVMFATAEAEDRVANQKWKARGFHTIGEVEDAASARRFAVYSSGE